MTVKRFTTTFSKRHVIRLHSRARSRWYWLASFRSDDGFYDGWNGNFIHWCAHSSNFSSVDHLNSTTKEDLQPSWWGRNVWFFTVAEAIRRANERLPNANIYRHQTNRKQSSSNHLISFSFNLLIIIIGLHFIWFIHLDVLWLVTWHNYSLNLKRVKWSLRLSETHSKELTEGQEVVPLWALKKSKIHSFGVIFTLFRKIALFLEWFSLALGVISLVSSGFSMIFTLVRVTISLFLTSRD